jgi:hypothetical protein
MKAYWGMDVDSHIFLTSALVGGKWLASRLCRFTSVERILDTHLIGDWVGPRAGLGYVDKRKFLTLHRLELQPTRTMPTMLSLLPRHRYVLRYVIYHKL